MTANETYLLFILSRNQVYPICDRTFNFYSHMPRCRKSSTIGSLIVHRDSKSKAVRTIKRRRIYGENAFAKIVSLIYGTYEIETEFYQLGKIELSGLKNLLLATLPPNRPPGDQYIEWFVEDVGEFADVSVKAEAFERIIEGIHRAETHEAVFAAINMPPVEDCLDGL